MIILQFLWMCIHTSNLLCYRQSLSIHSITQPVDEQLLCKQERGGEEWGHLWWAGSGEWCLFVRSWLLHLVMHSVAVLWCLQCLVLSSTSKSRSDTATDCVCVWFYSSRRAFFAFFYYCICFRRRRSHRPTRRGRGQQQQPVPCDW